MRRLFSWAAYATATAAILWMIFVIVSLTTADDAATNERRALQTQIADQQSEIAGQTQAAQLLADQVTALGERPIISPERIIPGIPGLSGLPGLNGIDGRDGRDGKSVTGAQGESITGPQGVPGESIKGDPGTDGKDGAAGKPGSNGKDGRSVTGVSCDADGRFVFTFSNGTTKAVGDAGMCATPAPAPAA